MKPWSKMIVWIVAVIFVVGGCAPKNSSVSYNSLDNDTLRISGMSDEEYLEKAGEDTLGDFMAASPFYISEEIQHLFEDQSYFELFDRKVEDLLIRSSRIKGNLDIALMPHLDHIVYTVLDSYEKAAIADPTYQDLYDQLSEEYAEELTQLSILSAQLNAYVDSNETDDYINDWNKYLQVYKSADLGDRAARFATRLVSDGVILFEEYEKVAFGDSITKMEMENMILNLESLEGQEFTIQSTVDEVGAIFAGLKELEKADAYMVMSLLQGMMDFTEEASPKINAIELKDGITQDMIDMAKDSNVFHQEMGLYYGAQLVEGYGLMEASQLALHYHGPASDDQVLFSKAFFGSKTVQASESVDGTSSKLYYEQAKELTKIAPVKENKKEGFFSKIKKKVLSTAGTILEKTSNRIYNYAFDSYASDLGVDAKTIAEEKARVLVEEKRRIANNEAGAEVYENSIKMIDKYVDGGIGIVSDYVLGEDSNTSKMIKEGSKFAVGCFTGSAKAMITMANPKTKTGDFIKAAVDVALTTAAGADAASKFIKSGINKTLSLGSRIAKPTAELTGTIMKKTLVSVGKLKEVISKNVGKFGDKLVSTIGKSPKSKAVLDVVYDKSVSAIGKSQQYFDETFEMAGKQLSNFGNKVKDKLVTINNKTTINNALVKNAIGESSGDVIKNYVQGLALGYIPGMINSTLENFESAYKEEEILIAQGEDQADTDPTTPADGDDPATGEDPLVVDGDMPEDPAKPDDDPTDPDSADPIGPPDSQGSDPGSGGGSDEGGFGEFEGATTVQPVGITGEYNGVFTEFGMFDMVEKGNDPFVLTLTTDKLRIKGNFVTDDVDITFTDLKYRGNELYASVIDNERDLVEVKMSFDGNGNVIGRILMYYRVEYLGYIDFEASK
ncbi:hypothetical protein J0B03_04100 [Alkalibacter rhizosphaerae]|uniref:Uncharacterized protein n=1 Tax=Alkalibacter rhizosphaerae TaxID=2815577 RepID=A0A974XG95_9FIRM|nr:hypothetical protein [Alkalibacter rhizosphaerae]QSX09253.1 hypothetical protein J0B03_04100 [Alkalibacter rhizosphaerae]